mgnify:CR=1 FL=1
MMPERIQRRRTKGWRMPLGVIYVGRPSIYGNPFGRFLSDAEDRHVAVVMFREWWEGRGLFRGNFMYTEQMEMLMGAMFQLRGKNLACWCPLCGQHRNGKPFSIRCPDCTPCHADTLGELANS